MGAPDMSCSPASGGPMCRIVSMGPVAAAVLSAAPGGGGGAEAASVLEPGWAEGVSIGASAGGGDGDGGGSSIVPVGSAVLLASLPGAFCPTASLLRAAWLPVFAAVASVEAGDNGVSFSVYNGSGSTAFPCLLAVCLRAVDVEMGAAY